MQQTNKETSVIAVTENQVAENGNLHVARAPGGTGILTCFTIAGVIGAALSCVAINRSHDYFQLPQELTSQIGISDELQARFDSGELSGGEVMGLGLAEQDPELQANVNEANRLNYKKNSALSFAVVGLLVAGFLGLAAGLTRKSPGPAVVGLLSGAILGGGLGAVGGYAVVMTEDTLSEFGGVDQIVRTVAMHGTGWALLGVAVGVAAGFATQKSDCLRLTAAAIVSGVVAACLFSLGAAILFPGDNADLPVPDGTGNRLMWTGLCAVLMAIAVGRIVARSANIVKDS